MKRKIFLLMFFACLFFSAHSQISYSSGGSPVLEPATQTSELDISNFSIDEILLRTSEQCSFTKNQLDNLYRQGYVLVKPVSNSYVIVRIPENIRIDNFGGITGYNGAVAHRYAVVGITVDSIAKSWTTSDTSLEVFSTKDASLNSYFIENEETVEDPIYSEFE